MTHWIEQLKQLDSPATKDCPMYHFASVQLYIHMKSILSSYSLTESSTIQTIYEALNKYRTRQYVDIWRNFGFSYGYHFDPFTLKELSAMTVAEFCVRFPELIRETSIYKSWKQSLVGKIEKVKTLPPEKLHVRQALTMRSYHGPALFVEKDGKFLRVSHYTKEKLLVVGEECGKSLADFGLSLKSKFYLLKGLSSMEPYEYKEESVEAPVATVAPVLA